MGAGRATHSPLVGGGGAVVVVLVPPPLPEEPPPQASPRASAATEAVRLSAPTPLVQGTSEPASISSLVALLL